MDEKELEKVITVSSITTTGIITSGSTGCYTITDYSIPNGTWVLCGNSNRDFIPTKVIFNPPATICFFPDGSKVIVKCASDEEFVEEEGVMACIVKKIFGSRNSFKKLVKKAYRQPPSE